MELKTGDSHARRQQQIRECEEIIGCGFPLWMWERFLVEDGWQVGKWRFLSLSAVASITRDMCARGRCEDTYVVVAKQVMDGGGKEWLIMVPDPHDARGLWALMAKLSTYSESEGAPRLSLEDL
ncbi:MAG: hypothetical protein Q4C87_02090 [Actinomycetaceae bacterium]|nr:hypothetical protein [Actinomycetaceae bacterium]